ncbi:U-box domain-containing protein 44-like isoform X2 [Oryza brachyantha]|uniref:U-box domain-containing protein 44-like isoform X2 n=1 Tax=Oryza brachyantha TaxID=4533 RepID=UPI001ADA479F|nr:U-box domain-containing protein 44-like isoform X2 [Oryza brachyantha]
MPRTGGGGRGGGVAVDVEDFLVRVKNGDDAELAEVAREVAALAEQGRLGEDDDEDGVLVPALLARLAGAGTAEARVRVMAALRRLARCVGCESKERLASIESLSSIVRSLSRDVDEAREAIALLLDLSDIPQVRPRIGRIKGSIVMLVTLRNANEPDTHDDAEKLLHMLSSNPQNVLLMAEAGYFRPLINYLKEGSDMNKILMATAISKMFLSEQMKSSLGEDGAVEPLVEMFKSGNLEAKHSALGPLLQLLFSVTSVLMTLREPASAILAAIAQSDRILLHKDVAPQMLSLLNLSSPVIQLHLLRALNSISGHTNAKRARAKIRKNGGVQLLLPFLTEKNVDIKIAAMNFIFNLSKDASQELTEQIRDTHLKIFVKIISSTTSGNEKTAAIGILSNLPVTDNKITEFLTEANLLPLLISLLETNITTSLTPQRTSLLEGIAGVLIRFTVPWDKKLQSLAVGHGVVPCLVKLLSEGSIKAKSKAATSLAQLSQNSVALRKTKLPRWLCVAPSAETYCFVHNCQCTVKSTFCLVKAGAISPLIQILEDDDREADGAVLEALATLMQDEIWENGSKVIEKASGVHALLRIAEAGNSTSQEKAIWMLERIFRLEAHREHYGEIAQALLIDLAQKGDPVLKPMIGKILAHLELLQTQSSYF